MSFLWISFIGICASWIFFDQTRQGRGYVSAVSWVFFAFTFPMITIPLYLFRSQVVRKGFSLFSREPKTMCSRCGKDNVQTSRYCSSCHNELLING